MYLKDITTPYRHEYPRLSVVFNVSVLSESELWQPSCFSKISPIMIVLFGDNLEQVQGIRTTILFTAKDSVSFHLDF